MKTIVHIMPILVFWLFFFSSRKKFTLTPLQDYFKPHWMSSRWLFLSTTFLVRKACYERSCFQAGNPGGHYSGWIVLTGVALQSGERVKVSSNLSLQLHIEQLGSLRQGLRTLLWGGLKTIYWDRAALPDFPCHGGALNCWPYNHEPTLLTLGHRMNPNSPPPPGPLM